MTQSHPSLPAPDLATREGRIAAGWVETAPNRWQLPDGDAAEARARDRVAEPSAAGWKDTPRGPQTSWRLSGIAPRHVAARRVTAEDLLDPVSRASARAATYAVAHARAQAAAARVEFARLSLTHRDLRADHSRRWLTHRPLLRRTVGGVVCVRMVPIASILGELHADVLAATAETHTHVATADAARKRRDDGLTPARRARKAAAVAARRQAETPDQRATRLSRMREAARARRQAAKQARLAAAA